MRTPPPRQFGGWPLSSTPFQVVGGVCHDGESLAPGKTCTIEVVMVPTVSGLFQSKLEITDTAPGSPQSVELEGTATAAPAPAGAGQAEIERLLAARPAADRHRPLQRPADL